MLRRVIVDVFTGDNGNYNGDDAYQLEQHRRLQTSHDRVIEDQSEASLFSSLLVSEPGDKLCATLQHQEASTKHESLATIVSPTGSLHKAQLKYLSLLAAGSGLPFLQDHLASSDGAENAVNLAREELLSTAGVFLLFLLFIYLYIYLSSYLSIYLSIYLSMYNAMTLN